MAPLDWNPTFTIPPPKPKYCILSYPAPNILLVTLNRPDSLNCINSEGNIELHKVWTWMDAEPSISVGIITGNGRAFCAGADLKGTWAINTIPLTSDEKLNEKPFRMGYRQ